MTIRSAAIYRFSISRMNLFVRFILVACAALPLLPFLFVIQDRLWNLSVNETLLAMMLGTLFFIPVHELLHGLFFRLYHRRVTYGFKPWSAFGPVFYASSAGSFFSRLQYQAVCLGPQLLTVLLALTILLPLPDIVVVAAIYTATLNLGGGVVDIFVATHLLKFPRHAIIEDTLDGMKVYLHPDN